MRLTSSFNVGGLSCHCLNAGSIRLDGGAMFGVVAKPLWEKHFESDDLNRILLQLRCLLIEHEAGPVLIDTGVGNKENEKFRRIYAVDNTGARGRTMLEDALAEVGVVPEDVRFVINTHLHFDHAGGNTFVEEREGEVRDGEPGRPVRHQSEPRPSSEPPHRRPATVPQLSFPRATHIVQRGELEAAQSPHERSAASYLVDNHQPVSEADAWRLVDGERELLPGISTYPTPGHTPHHQSVLIEDAGEVACFVGDLIPTAAHVPLPWIMAYDLEPLTTLATKRDFLARAAEAQWRLVFEHDPAVALGLIEEDSKTFVCVPLDTL